MHVSWTKRILIANGLRVQMLSQTWVVMVKNHDGIKANKSGGRKMKAQGAMHREMIGITQELIPARLLDLLL